MTISIADAVSQILAQPPAPVILIDTCSFVDLFRRDEKRFQPRVPAQEIQAAADLVDLLTSRPDAAQLIVPELIPREYADHADREEATFGGWTAFHDDNQNGLLRHLCASRWHSQRRSWSIPWDSQPGSGPLQMSCWERPRFSTVTRDVWTARSSASSTRPGLLTKRR